MKTKQLGKSNLEIPPLIFGTNIFGWTVDERASHRLLDKCKDLGLNCIDTADVYSRWVPGNQGGESETIVGNWLKKTGDRDKMIICTKVGKEMPPGKKGLSAKYIYEAVDASLSRLQTDYIDLYQSHDDDQSVPLEETLAAYTDLIAKGKVRVIGASNYSGARLIEANEVSKKNSFARYESLQPLYNLYDRNPFEEELLAVCKQLDIGVISFYSLASGFLTGKYRSEKDYSKSQRGAHMSKYFSTRGLSILAALDRAADRYRVTPAAIALAWLMAKPTIAAPIASATTDAQLEALFSATTIELDEKAISSLDEASS